MVILYLTELPQGDPVQFEFRIKALFEAKAIVPDSVAFLYYEPDLRAEFGGKPITAASLEPSGDIDGDGLPNDWEIENGLDAGSAEGDDGAQGDPDNDGFTNLEEFQNDTDPQVDESQVDGETTEGEGEGRRIFINCAAAGPPLAGTAKPSTGDLLVIGFGLVLLFALRRTKRLRLSKKGDF